MHPENTVTYSVGNGGQKICGVFLETASFKSYGVKRKRKSQYANYIDLAYLLSGFPFRCIAKHQRLLHEGVQACVLLQCPSSSVQSQLEFQ